MSYLFWIFIGVIGAAACWWILDWHDQHEDGE
jgi:hypothetical protein